MATSTYYASEVIAELLRKELFGVNPEQFNSDFHWPIYVDQVWTDPHDAIGVITQAVPTDGRIMRTGETQGLTGFQVQVRSLSFAKARQKISEIETLFDSVLQYEVVVQETLYQVHAIHQLMRPAFIGADPNNRITFTLDCIAKFYKLTE